MATHKPGTKGNLEDQTRRAGERLEKEKDAATRAAGQAWDTAKQAGSDAAKRAQQEARAQGERLKDETSGELDAFADAIKAASDRLSERKHGTTSELIEQAASGLHDISEALQRRSTGDIVNSIRDFGRHNPTAFIAGSVLAGFALGRFAGASASHSHESETRRTAGQTRGTPGPAPSKARAASGTRTARPAASPTKTMRTGG